MGDERRWVGYLEGYGCSLSDVGGTDLLFSPIVYLDDRDGSSDAVKSKAGDRLRRGGRIWTGLGSRQLQSNM